MSQTLFAFLARNDNASIVLGRIATYYFVVLCLSQPLFKPTQCQGEINPRFGTDIYKNLQKNNIDILMFSFSLKMSLDVCVATSVSIQTNFNPAAGGGGDFYLPTP